MIHGAVKVIDSTGQPPWILARKIQDVSEFSSNKTGLNKLHAQIVKCGSR